MKRNTNTKTAVKETTKEVKVNTVLRDEDIDKLMDEHATKSSLIRYLASRGHKTADIAKAMNIRYQHVRNVLVKDAEKQQQTK